MLNFNALVRLPCYPELEQQILSWLAERNIPSSFVLAAPRLEPPDYSHIDTFFEETFDLDSPRDVPYKLVALYQMYNEWCSRRGVSLRAGMNGAFREALHRLGFRRANTWNNQRVWYGPQLKTLGGDNA